MLHYYFQTKLYMKRITYFIFLVFCLSCHKEEDTILDSSGVAVKLPSLWNTSISDDGKLAEVIIDDAIVHNNTNGLVGGRKKNQRSIISLNGIDGSKNWEWSDLLGLINDPTYLDPFYFGPNGSYIKDNKLFFYYSTSSYCLDLQTGITNWKHKVNLSRSIVASGVGDLTLCPAADYNNIDDENIYIGGFKTGQLEGILLKPLYTKVDKKTTLSRNGYVRGLEGIIQNKDTLISIAFTDPVDDITKNTPKTSAIGLYNLSNRKWVYERVGTSQAIGFVISDGKYLYHTSLDGIGCTDILTGQPIWSNVLNQKTFGGNMILQNSKIFVAAGDRNLYCLDANTGSIIWKEANTGTCSNLSYLNGILYYLGGGDGLLHAVDTATGKHLWKLKSPDLSTNSGAWFYGTCVAVPGKDGKKGTVIATTGIHAYGYEAIR